MEREFDRAKAICCHFSRNFAYFKSGEDKGHLLESNNFWRIINGNFAEIALIEFCKLFGGWQDKHRWQEIIDDHASFIADIEANIEISFEDFMGYVKEVKGYRDKYLSHLDNVANIPLPPLDIAMKAVNVYYEHILKIDGPRGFPESLKELYIKSHQEAIKCYPPET